MLTHCPECQKELSTAATQCPHCGAPMNQGHLAGGGAPMATPVAPGYSQQAGYPGQPMQPPPPQPQSHCLRNCLIFGCILFVLAVVAVVGSGWYLKKKLGESISMDPKVVAAMGQKVAPGATAPTGYTEKFGIDWNMFGGKAQGVVITNGDGNPQQSTVIIWGALNAKPQDRAQLQDSFQKALAAGSGGGGAQSGAKKTTLEETVELTVAGEPTKVLHMVIEDEHTEKKTENYYVLLDPWNNEFGWLGVGAVGPEGKFDLEGFKAFLATLKK